MRLVICLVFLASFALVCQGHRDTYTYPFSLSRATGPLPLSPTVCSSSSLIIINDTDACACC
uniref:Penaeidin-like antimicrobial peptide n=1 Tax=Penaeus indicus TaxID=29960 RepID=D9J163_PENIN|nr:penaeidin-like antimicrobial peptide [Penaeus indicus]